MEKQVNRLQEQIRTASSRDARLRVGIIAGDPLRMLGFQSLFSDHAVIAIVPVAEAAPLHDLDIDLMVIAAQNASQVFEAISRVHTALPKVRMIVMAASGEQEFIDRVLRVGAHGYLKATAEIDEMEDAIARVYEGAIWTPVSTGNAPVQIAAGVVEQGIYAPGAYTERELQVLSLLSAGQSNREIAISLRIEERTVKSHVARLLKKMGVKNRTALTMQAIHHRLVGHDS